MKSFSLLRKEVRKALSKSKFKRPTDIQEVAIPAILKGKNALIIAPTGIGKTEAAILPVFDQFLKKRPNGISLLYITPLRALNRDLLDRIEFWGKALRIKISVRHGDTTQYQRRKQALSPPDMLITTPETLQAILPGRRMKTHLKNVRWVIVDEIHELVEDKRGAQLSLGLERLLEVADQRFQRIGISATIGSPEIVSKFLVNKDEIEILKVSPSKDVEITVERPRPKKGDKLIAEAILTGLETSSKIRRMEELIEGHNSSLIFVNTRQMAEILASRFKILDKEVGIHHSSLSQEARIAMEEDFKEGKVKGLICTSSLELGIDIGRVDLVIQYMSPRQVTRLLQRIGRSGHKVGGKSKGIIIATDSDDILESLVIARNALAEELEELEVIKKPYDVLSHQIVGMALDFGFVKKEKAFEIAKRSFIFTNLEMEEFEAILRLLSNLGLIWVEDDSFKRRKAAWKYYYDNLSTIPDQRRYFVKNIASRSSVGVLDEKFVVNSLDQGSMIIFRGMPWQIISVDEDEVLVEPVDDVIGAIPTWVGEEIPVPYNIAKEVGVLRKNAEDQRIFDRYPCDSYTKKIGVSKIKRQLKEGIPVGDDKKIVVELLDNFVVINSCFGIKVNQTLGRLFSILLSSRFGHSIGLNIDPYRIILQAPSKISEELLKEAFDLDSDFIEPLLYRSLKRTSLFKWKFFHVARRFGAISKEVSYSDINLGRVISAYDDSLLYKETLKEIFRDNLDLLNTKRVLDELKDGKIEIEYLSLKGPSPLAELGLKTYAEIIIPERAEKIILKVMKKRIYNQKVDFFCLYCTKWSGNFRVKNVVDDLKCAKCGARMLAVITYDAKRLKKIYRRYRDKKALTHDEKAEIKRLRISANLFLSYGKNAAVAIAARGIGPETAKRVLVASRNEGGLYRNILKAERDYARTRRFWD
ncbi:MAG: DEAD/DEAH box helicase [Candidatus Hydrothermarchaeales archaeon]